MIMKHIHSLICRKNKGTTLIEMIVAFALLGIFLAVATAVIVRIANLYYDIKGETYAEQVSDILLEKISSEIDGAKYYSGDPKSIPLIDGNINNNIGESIKLIDKTGTSVKLYTDSNGMFAIYYDAINDTVNPDNDRKATVWKFDENVYNGFALTELKFIRGDGVSEHSDDISSYGISGGNYDDNVILVLLTIDSPKYGEYKEYRFIKMYYVPEGYTENVVVDSNP